MIIINILLARTCVCVCVYTCVYIHKHNTYINKQLSWTSEYVSHSTVMSAELLPDVTELIY